MSLYSISTLQRFLYLNLYAFLLIFVGIGIMILPLRQYGWFFTLIQVLACLYCEKTALKMLNSWKEKKRKYAILIERNQNGFRADTFKEFMHAPCGILLVKLVLKDLNMRNEYPTLKRYSSSLRQMMKLCCKKQVTEIKFYKGDS